MHRAPRIVSGLLAALMIFGLTGCVDSTDQKTDITPDGIVIYDTDTAPDGNNYAIYTGKEINLVMNILSTHMANATSVTRGKYIVADALTAVKGDLDKVAEAIDSVEGLNPPSEYEDDREVILERLVNAQSTLEAYRDALDNGETDLADFTDLMEGDYVLLSSAFNLLWE